MRVAVLFALVVLAACESVTAPKPVAPLPYSVQVRDSLAYLNAHRIAYQSSLVIGHCISPDTIAFWIDGRRANAIFWLTCR